jgi:adenine phosphoribosyltransferase
VNTSDLKKFIRDVPDFPKPGITFKDITPLVADPGAFNRAVELMSSRLMDSGADEILAIESRGFLFGAALSARMSIPLQLVRKPGKLPGATVGMDYKLEYGTDRVEIHSGVFHRDRRYAIVDDLIATGGTASATMKLARDHDAEVSCCCFLIELGFLRGRDKLNDCRVESLLIYD